MHQVSIHGMSNEKIILDVCEQEKDFNNTTVMTLKQKLIDARFPGLQSENIRLLFVGKQLEDDRTLESYKIQNKSVIMSVIRSHGGAFYFLE